MSDEEALERLSKGLDAWCKYSGAVTFPGDADVRISDIRTLIAEREGLEREVERLTDALETRKVMYDLVVADYEAAEGYALSVAPPSQGMETLVQALEDVQNPLGRLKRLADERGCRLSGQAYAITNSLTYVQSIARDALAALQSHKGKADSELAAADNNHKADCTTSGGAG